MDNFKFNAQKMLAAQKAKERRAQSPETESNWDSSDPDENTVTQISSDEEFSVRSTRSHKSTKSAKGASKADTSKTRTPSKPDPVNSHRKDLKPTNDGLSSTKGRPAVNVFVDRGGIDSDDQSQKSTKKTKRKKEEKPPYDFREALKGDDDDDPPSHNVDPRPGRSRKGESYDPAPPKTKPKQKEQIADTGSWDESDENQKALTQILRERDGLESNNNTNRKESLPDQKDEDAPEEISQKKKGWSIRLKSKSKEKKKKEKLEEPPREMQVAMTTPPVPSIKHSEVDVVYKKEEEEETETVISLGSDEIGTRYVYIYHHGNTSYADTRPSQEAVYMTTIADKSEVIFRRCAREIFAALRILIDFFLIFILEALRFLIFNIISNFIVGLITGFGDYFLRPVATAIFNGLCQPFAMFWYNVGVATRTSTRPFVDILHNFLSLVAMVIRAFRLVEINPTRLLRTAVEDV